MKKQKPRPLRPRRPHLPRPLRPRRPRLPLLPCLPRPLLPCRPRASAVVAPKVIAAPVAARVPNRYIVTRAIVASKRVASRGVLLLTVVSILALSSICLSGEILHRCVTDGSRVGSNGRNEARKPVSLMRDPGARRLPERLAYRLVGAPERALHQTALRTSGRESHAVPGQGLAHQFLVVDWNRVQMPETQGNAGGGIEPRNVRGNELIGPQRTPCLVAHEW